MNAQQSYIIREITPLSDKDCFYVAERYKTEFTYPIHNHAEFELNFCEKAAGVRRIVGDSAEVIGDYDLVLITGQDLVAQLKGEEADEILITESMLRQGEEIFLDDMTLEQAQQQLGIRITPVPDDGADLLYALRGTEE